MSSLILAVPSKGRLQEQVQAYFTDAGAPIEQAAGGRGYRATLRGLPNIDVMLLPAADIAASLHAGDAHMGITGEDLLRETVPALEGVISLLKPLGFGFADVVVAVPRGWVDVSSMADLDDVCAAFFQRHKRRLRVATKFATLTRGFFAAHGIWDYRIVESLGATEGAPAAGTAEIIVDITTTGATLAANGLKTLEDGTILKSQAQLAASCAASWDQGSRSAAKTLLARFAARERARSAFVLRARLESDPDSVLEALAAEAGVRVLSRPAPGNSGGEFSLLCPRPSLMDAVTILRRKGGGDSVTAQSVDYVFESEDPLVTSFEAAFG